MTDAVQEAQDKNIDAFLGLTDSIIGIIKSFPISEQEPTNEDEKLAAARIARSLTTVSILYIMHYYYQYHDNDY